MSVNWESLKNFPFPCSLTRGYPLVNVSILPWGLTMFAGKTQYKWPFSIAMSSYWRACVPIQCHPFGSGDPMILDVESARKGTISTGWVILLRPKNQSLIYPLEMPHKAIENGCSNRDFSYEQRWFPMVMLTWARGNKPRLKPREFPRPSG